MSTINLINLPDLFDTPPTDENEKIIDGKWQYTVNYRESTVLQKIVDTIVALVTTIFTFGFYRGNWSDVFHGRERKVKFEQIDVKDQGECDTTILMTYISSKTLIETAKAIAVTVFTLGIGLAFKRTREMWSIAFQGQREEQDIEHAVWYAADWRKWHLVEKMLELNPKVNINAAPTERFDRDSVLWMASLCRQWNLVEKMLDKHPHPNVNTAPTHGNAAGESALWSAAFWKKWSLVEKMLDKHSEANVNAAPTREGYTGGSVLWYITKCEQWDLVEKILKTHPKANVNAAPTKGGHAGKSVLWYITKCEQWDLVENILKTRPEADVNAAPTKGKHAGKSVLCWADFHGKQDLVKKMKEKLSKANV